MIREIKIDLQYQPLIEGPPPKEGNIHERACRNDDSTINSWRPTWLSRKKENKEAFGDLGSKSIGKLYGINRHRPVIICGSGPSLKNSIKALQDNLKADHPVLNVSCLHNFGYFEDEGCHADYYLTLDAGEIVIDDVFEGRKENAQYYWERTEGKKLLACAFTPKKLLELWKGEIFFFDVIIPEAKLHTELQEIEKFTHFISCGGNALGACLYAAQAIMGSHVVHMVGADFCFDYDDKFHSYPTHYDDVGAYIRHVDVFGIPRKTWASYMSFKLWFDWVACNVPGRYVNCSEGILGAYAEGNIRQFDYMPLEKALLPYRVSERIFLERRGEDNTVISKEEIKLKDYFSNTKFEKDLAFF